MHFPIDLDPRPMVTWKGVEGGLSLTHSWMSASPTSESLEADPLDFSGPFYKASIIRGLFTIPPGEPIKAQRCDYVYRWTAPPGVGSRSTTRARSSMLYAQVVCKTLCVQGYLRQAYLVWYQPIGEHVRESVREPVRPLYVPLGVITP